MASTGSDPVESRSTAFRQNQVRETRQIGTNKMKRLEARAGVRLEVRAAVKTLEVQS